MPLDKETKAEIVSILRQRTTEDSGPKITDSGLKEFLKWQNDKREEEEKAEDEALAQKRKRRKFMGWVVGVLIPAVPTGGYAYVQYVPNANSKVMPSDVKREVGTRVGGLEKTINGCEAKIDEKGGVVACTPDEEKRSVKHTSQMADKKANRLGDLHFEQRKLIIEQYDAIRAAQNASDARARRVPDPPSLKDARTQLKAYEERKRRENLDAAMKQGDPFADL